jgi:hypothetical protein
LCVWYFKVSVSNDSFIVTNGASAVLCENKSLLLHLLMRNSH